MSPFLLVKLYLDSVDNLVQPPYDITRIKQVILSYFNIKDHFGILAHAYDDFTKAKFAGLCLKIAEEAHKGDQLANWLFTENGKWLAKHVVALCPKMSAKLLCNGLAIVCVGSVWKSWSLMQKGFMSELKEGARGHINRVRLIQLKVPMSIGACYLASDKAQIKLAKTYSDNSIVFFEADL